MTMEFVDKSREPPSPEDIQRARLAVETAIVRHIMDVPPVLAVELANILRCLKVFEVIAKHAKGGER